MQKIAAIDHERVDGKAKKLLDAIKSKICLAAKMLKAMARSAKVLETYLTLSGAPGITFDARLREEVALTTAEINGWNYCSPVGL